MNWLEAIILGLVQGLTEFLPVSSSGHLELGKYLLNINPEKSLVFTVVVHGATVLSTMVVFWKDIWQIVKGLFKFQLNEETLYVFKLIVSMIPVLIIGVFFMDEVEQFFNGNIVFVGSMLLITSALLAITMLVKSNTRNIRFLDAFIIGIAQALAVLPGISRSGATISTGLIIGNKKELITRFSFLMVLVPIIGANAQNIMSTDVSVNSGVGFLPLLAGFLAAFISGLFACKWMIKIVNKGKLIYFAIYTFVIGTIAIIVGLL
ncbi:MAG: undecaprenyl-diphosphate phosphatase [Bacteroidales bacterium]|jgi:undecaprenyl-diphosphatase|nr:undecaprenyl-diphosphate phosphatase [Bacteroidales bacterium]